MSRPRAAEVNMRGTSLLMVAGVVCIPGAVQAVNYYCQPCTSDTDCGGTDNDAGISSNGNYCLCANAACDAGFCSTACTSSASCEPSAICEEITGAAADGGMVDLGKGCAPASGDCLPDGGAGTEDGGPAEAYYCRACQSDSDCGGVDNDAGVSSNGNYCLCADSTCSTSFCGTKCTTSAQCPVSASCQSVVETLPDGGSSLPDGGNLIVGTDCLPNSGTCSPAADGGASGAPDAGTASGKPGHSGCASQPISSLIVLAVLAGLLLASRRIRSRV